MPDGIVKWVTNDIVIFRACSSFHFPQLSKSTEVRHCRFEETFTPTSNCFFRLHLLVDNDLL
jgi:hypothetical protein